MIVTRLACQNWRNIPECVIPFSGGINVLWGMNAQGKSNLLESIYFFARGRSFRGAKDKELVRFGCDYSTSRLSFRKDGYQRDTALEAVIPLTGKKRLSRNDAPITPGEMMGTFRAVLFCPANLTIVSGGPLERRTFLDIAVSQLSPLYLSLLRKYTKLLAERNALLKSAGDGAAVTAEEWEVYAEGLAECGARIAAFRQEYVTLLADAVTEYFSGMTDGLEIPTFTYTSHALTDGMPHPLTGDGESRSEAAKEQLFRKLTDNIAREIAAGSTLWGIHKDDISVLLNGKEARLYASQGQQRSLVLSMKLGEAEIARRVGGESPVILLDDVFSELDESRRRYLLDTLGKDGERQIIITSCEPDVIPSSVGARANMIHVCGGAVELSSSRKEAGE